MIPSFWPADPAVWFAQVEATFATKRLNNQKARFDFVVSQEVATEVRDLVLCTHRQPLQCPQGNTDQEDSCLGAEATPTAVPGRGIGGQKTYTALAEDASATG